MKTRVATRVLMVTMVFAGALAPAPRGSTAAEPYREFLQGLRDRGYYDVALDYLDQMASSSLAPAEFKEVLLYEKGVTLIEGSHLQRDLGIRQKQLDEAQTLLKQFMTTRATHPLVSSANTQLGNLLVQRARMNTERAKSAAPAQKTALIQEARTMYDEAFQLFKKTEEDLKQKLAAIKPILNPNDKVEAQLIEKRDQLRSEYLQAQLLSAAIREETADTVAEGSKDHTDLLTESANQYNEIYEKYRTRLAGLYARLYQGRCYVKMKDYKQALTNFRDLLDQPDQPEAFRTLKVKTLVYAVDCWLDPKDTKYAEAITRLVPLIDSANTVELRQPEWLYLQLSLAKAYKLRADDLAKANKREDQPAIKKSTSDAYKLADFVSKQPSDYQDSARKLLVDLGKQPAAAGGPVVPKSFAEAKSAGRDALESVQVASLTLSALPKRIAEETDEKLKAEYQKQLQDAQATKVKAPQDAVNYFKMALNLADEETPLDEVNVVQYYLCYLFYTQAAYFDSAVVGEFLARRYPNSAGARQSAKIAMASYLKLYSDKQNAEKALFAQLDKDQDGKLAGDELEQLSAERRDRLSTADASGDGALDQTEFAATSDAFETDKILNVALYITETWPSQPEAAEALNTLIPFMIREGKLKEAQVYLQRIPLDSPARGEAELKTGQAMWGAYLRGMQDVRKWEQEGLVPEGVDPAAEKARLVEVKNNAEKTLADGVGRMQQAGTVDRTLATAVLSLAQIYVDTDQAAKAVQLLEDPKIGILKLVASNDPATSTPGLAEETYKTALRAYISHLAKAADPQQSDATIDKAKGVMEALKTTVGPTPEDQRKLVAIYYSLALDLKQQLKLVESPEAKDALSKGFETFLKQVGSGAAELNIIYWVAETFANMGEEFQGPGGILTPDAKRYYEQAVATYQSILDQAQALKLDAQMQTQVRMRQAMMWRQLGEFEKSINAFATVLRENNMLLNVQIEAARTYQEWAGKGVPGHYDDAMKGAMPDAQTKKNVIWGWGRLAQITAGAMSRSRDNPEAREGYRSTFHESRYNLALCRLLLARSQTNTAERRKYMDYAKRDITMTHSLYPDLGGPDWMAKYNDLLKRIQTELAEPAVGLTMPATTGQNR